jgi:hypothetical protein
LPPFSSMVSPFVAGHSRVALMLEIMPTPRPAGSISARRIWPVRVAASACYRHRPTRASHPSCSVSGQV